MASAIIITDKELRDETMDIMLREVHNKFVSIKEHDFKYYFNIFIKVIESILEAMGQVDNLFRRYPNKMRHVGSHYDNLKIGKPDEFDVDIVLCLPPLMEGNLILEQMQPGFVALARELRPPKASTGEEVPGDWWDQNNFLLQFSIRNWFNCTVQKAFDILPKNKYGESIIKVDNEDYTVRSADGDPALLIQIRNRNEPEFGIDVDLVPAIEFSWSRLPSCFNQSLQDTRAKSWYVVPSSAESIENDYLRNMTWRFSFGDQEKEILDNVPNMRPIIRLVKKIRDSLGMTLLSSYAIKVLFLWESDNTQLWNNNHYSKQLIHMLRKLHRALETKMIPNYWYEGNLLHSVEDYADRVKRVLAAAESVNKEMMFKFLVTDKDLQVYLT